MHIIDCFLSLFFFRKAEVDEEESRKHLKTDDSEPEHSPYASGETLESVQIFHDFPLDGQGTHSITTTQHNVDLEPLPIYTDVPLHTTQDTPQETPQDSPQNSPHGSRHSEGD